MNILMQVGSQFSMYNLHAVEVIVKVFFSKLIAKLIFSEEVDILTTFLMWPINSCLWMGEGEIGVPLAHLA